MYVLFLTPREKKIQNRNITFKNFNTPRSRVLEVPKMCVGEVFICVENVLKSIENYQNDLEKGLEWLSWVV